MPENVVPAPAPGPVPTPPPGPVPVAHPQPTPLEIPVFRAPDVQMLIQDLAESRRAVIEERRNSQNRIAEERERSRFEIEKIRAETSAQMKALEWENEALLRGLGRAQAQVDELREENALLRHAKSNGHVEEKTPAMPVAPALDLASQFNRPPAKTMVPLAGQPKGVPRGAQQVTLQPQVLSSAPQPLPGVPSV